MFWHVMFLFLTLSISNMKVIELLLQNIFSSHLFLDDSISELQHAHLNKTSLFIVKCSLTRSQSVCKWTVVLLCGSSLKPHR